MGQLFLIAFATFASEDLTCLATGALIASGRLALLPGVLACAAGIYFGDLLLYFAGRAGRPVVRRLVPDAKVDRASAWLAARGAGVVLVSRFTPGLRLPTYVAAGLLKTRFWTFNSYFLMAALLWTPLLVGSAALLGKRFAGAPWIVVTLAIVWQTARMPWRTRRRILGRLRRKARWEFWPPWLAYIPVIPYVLYLGVKHRSLTLFTAANPGIPSGGFVGESKLAILSHLTRVPAFQVVPPGQQMRSPNSRVVLKPDIGERGTGVAIARTPEDVRRCLAAATAPTIVQKYVGGLEFGVFDYRYPGEPEGHIFSITRNASPKSLAMAAAVSPTWCCATAGGLSRERLFEGSRRARPLGRREGAPCRTRFALPRGGLPRRWTLWDARAPRRNR